MSVCFADFHTMKRQCRVGLFLVPRETLPPTPTPTPTIRGWKNPLLNEFVRMREASVRRWEREKEETKTTEEEENQQRSMMSMHWWGDQERSCGTIHATLSSFASLREKEVDVLIAAVRRGTKLIRGFQVDDLYLPRRPILKRKDAAAIVFEASTLEPFLDYVGRESCPAVAEAIENRRRMWNVEDSSGQCGIPTKSMTVIATDRIGESKGSGEPCDAFLSSIEDDKAVDSSFPLLRSMLRKVEDDKGDTIRRRIRFRLEGQVQGVKMRRYVESAGRCFGVEGFVLNTSDGGVYGEAEGEELDVIGFRSWLTDDFRPRILTDAKPTPIGIARPKRATVDRAIVVEATFDLPREFVGVPFSMVREASAAEALSKREPMSLTSSDDSRSSETLRSSESTTSFCSASLSWKSCFRALSWNVQVVACAASDYDAKTPWKSWRVLANEQL